MRLITKSFFETSTIEKNDDSISVMDFLASPQSVDKMIAATEGQNPALSGIVKELEEKFADNKQFPLNHDSEGKNAKNRRNVGWMVRYIMREYGYSPIEHCERTRIGRNSGSKYFGNATVYEKTNENSNYKIFNNTTAICTEWEMKDMIISKDDPNYIDMENEMRDASKKLKKLNISTGFIITYLLRTGFGKYIKQSDLVMVFEGLKVPCFELAEAIENALTLFEIFDYSEDKTDVVVL